MNHGQQGQQDVEIRRRTMGIPTEPAEGPWQGNQHPGKSVERNQPGGLKWQRESWSQKQRDLKGRCGACWPGNLVRNDAHGRY